MCCVNQLTNQLKYAINMPKIKRSIIDRQFMKMYIAHIYYMEHMPNIAKYFVLVMVAIVLTKMLKLQCYTGQFFHCKFLPNNLPNVSKIQNCRNIFRKKKT